MLSKKAQSVLRLMNQKDDYFLMKELCDGGYAARQQPFDWYPTSDYDEAPYEYRIMDKGRAFLETIRAVRKKKLLELICYLVTTAIAVAAFAKSFFG